jgi:GH35 family endo-1,4-beta-xylanase
MINLLTRLHDDTGLPVYITEYDINQNDDATQRARVEEQFRFFLDTEWIRGVTVWGWIFGRTWVASSGLIRNGTPRPAMVWLMDELGRPVPQ